MVQIKLNISWTTTESSININTYKDDGLNPNTIGRGSVIDKNTFDNVNIIFQGFPASGDLEIKITNTAIIDRTDLQAWLYIGGVLLNSNSLPSGLRTLGTMNSQASTSADDVEIYFGDAPDHENIEKLLNNYLTLSDGSLTSGRNWLWSMNSYNSYYEMMINDFALSFGLPKYILKGRISSNNQDILNICYHDVFSEKDFYLQTYSYYLIDDELDVTLSEMPTGTITMDENPAEEIPSSEGSGSSNSGSSGGGTGGTYHPLGGNMSLDLLANKFISNTLVLPGQSPLNLDNGHSAIWIGDTGFDGEPGSIPIASADTLGGIKVGNGLSIDSVTGVLSVTGGSGGISPHTLWGQPFDGTQDVSGALNNAGNITPSANGAYNLGSSSLRWAGGWINELVVTTLFPTNLIIPRTAPSPAYSGYSYIWMSI